MDRRHSTSFWKRRPGCDGCLPKRGPGSAGAKSKTASFWRIPRFSRSPPPAGRTRAKRGLRRGCLHHRGRPFFAIVENIGRNRPHASVVRPSTRLRHSRAANLHRGNQNTSNRLPLRVAGTLDEIDDRFTMPALWRVDLSRARTFSRMANGANRNRSSGPSNMGLPNMRRTDQRRTALRIPMRCRVATRWPIDRQTRQRDRNAGQKAADYGSTTQHGTTFSYRPPRSQPIVGRGTVRTRNTGPRGRKRSS